MIDPADAPRRQALHVGPGGVPVDSVRPIGPGAPTSASRAAGRDLPANWQQWAVGVPTIEPERRRMSGALIGRVAAVLITALAVGFGLWGNAHQPLRAASAGVAVGDCLSATANRVSGRVDCGPAADFTVVGRYAGTSDASQCTASPSDVAVVASGPTVLCLDYLATVGQCLFAGDRATRVGRVDCASTLPGVLRVTAVVRNSIDPHRCPGATLQSLIHRYNSEVLCLVAG